MSKMDIKLFLERLKSDENMQKKLKEMTDEKCLQEEKEKKLIQFAKDNNFNFTKDEITNLTEKELDLISGGINLKHSIGALAAITFLGAFAGGASIMTSALNGPGHAEATKAATAAVSAGQSDAIHIDSGDISIDSLESSNKTTKLTGQKPEQTEEQKRKGDKEGEKKEEKKEKQGNIAQTQPKQPEDKETPVKPEIKEVQVNVTPESGNTNGNEPKETGREMQQSKSGQGDAQQKAKEVEQRVKGDKEEKKEKQTEIENKKRKTKEELEKEDKELDEKIEKLKKDKEEYKKQEEDNKNKINELIKKLEELKNKKINQKALTNTAITEATTSTVSQSQKREFFSEENMKIINASCNLPDMDEDDFKVWNFQNILEPFHLYAGHFCYFNSKEEHNRFDKKKKTEDNKQDGDALDKFIDHTKLAHTLWKSGHKKAAMEQVGRAMHFLEDLNTPVHCHEETISSATTNAFTKNHSSLEIRCDEIIKEAKDAQKPLKNALILKEELHSKVYVLKNTLPVDEQSLSDTAIWTKLFNFGKECSKNSCLIYNKFWGHSNFSQDKGNDYFNETAKLTLINASNACTRYLIFVGKYLFNESANVFDLGIVNAYQIDNLGMGYTSADAQEEAKGEQAKLNEATKRGNATFKLSRVIEGKNDVVQSNTGKDTRVDLSIIAQKEVNTEKSDEGIAKVLTLKLTPTLIYNEKIDADQSIEAISLNFYIENNEIINVGGATVAGTEIDITKSNYNYINKINININGWSILNLNLGDLLKEYSVKESFSDKRDQILVNFVDNLFSDTGKKISNTNINSFKDLEYSIRNDEIPKNVTIATIMLTPSQYNKTTLGQSEEVISDKSLDEKQSVWDNKKSILCAMSNMVDLINKCTPGTWYKDGNNYYFVPSEDCNIERNYHFTYDSGSKNFSYHNNEGEKVNFNLDYSKSFDDFNYYKNLTEHEKLGYVLVLNDALYNSLSNITKDKNDSHKTYVDTAKEIMGKIFKEGLDEGDINDCNANIISKSKQNAIFKDFGKIIFDNLNQGQGGVFTYEKTRKSAKNKPDELNELENHLNCMKEMFKAEGKAKKNAKAKLDEIIETVNSLAPGKWYKDGEDLINSDVFKSILNVSKAAANMVNSGTKTFYYYAPSKESKFKNKYCVYYDQDSKFRDCREQENHKTNEDELKELEPVLNIHRFFYNYFNALSSKVNEFKGYKEKFFISGEPEDKKTYYSSDSSTQENSEENDSDDLSTSEENETPEERETHNLKGRNTDDSKTQGNSEKGGSFLSKFNPFNWRK